MKPVYIHSCSAVNAQCALREGGERQMPQEKRLPAREPDYKLCIRDAGLRRRMSRMVRMGVATALDCLEQLEKTEIDGILTATGLGCLADTERFMNTVLDGEERLLNPTPFIQSTFNTIGAQIALLCGNHSYNMTYVHRGFSFESALLDAQLMLEEGEARQVLVGAVDELTETAFRLGERLGDWKGKAVAGEGAHFFVLGTEEPAVAHPLIFRGMTTFRGALEAEAVCERIRDFLRQHQLEVSDLGLLLSGRPGRPAMDRGYDQVCENLFTGVPEVAFKAYSGEYPTASAFACWMATRLAGGEKWWDFPVPEKKGMLIYNTYPDTDHALILLERQ